VVVPWYLRFVALVAFTRGEIANLETVVIIAIIVIVILIWKFVIDKPAPANNNKRDLIERLALPVLDNVNNVVVRAIEGERVPQLTRLARFHNHLPEMPR
jgi:hypothetical protein